MNPISMVAAITTLILPIDYKTYIDDGLSEKLMRMGYSQEEITHFNTEKNQEDSLISNWSNRILPHQPSMTKRN